jgi:phenylalanyl-tRNA synthetase beta chain
MKVDSSTASIRPYVVCAVLRNITFDVKNYKNFIDLQEKLHQNICRKRTLVAIGTHDLDTLQGPFYYRALAPHEINFVPLTENEGKSYSGKELLDFYREDASVKHLKPYTDIIYNSPVYPVITDSKENVLSLPPIINSKHSRIQLHTKNVFIECTGTDLTKANIVLDTIITMFSEYCSNPFTVEEVEVVYENTNNNKTDITPLLSHRHCDTKVNDINSIIGINISPDKMCELCNKMQLGPAIFVSENNSIRVTVPPTRSDILHPVDVIEDIAIAYGYNNLEVVVPKTLTVGGPLPINQLTDLLRVEIAQCGYMEMLTHGLCSTAENFTYLNRPVGPAVSLSNPANIEYEVVRTTLIPGALKTLAHNKSMSHKDGIRLFEISDVVLVDETNEIGARNARRLVALHAAHTSAFEVVHGLVDKVMRCCQIEPEASYAAGSMTEEEIVELKRVARSNLNYFFVQSEDLLMFPGMRANIVLRKVNGSEFEDVVIGVLGVVHPDVLQKYEVTYPCSVVELDLEALL